MPGARSRGFVVTGLVAVVVAMTAAGCQRESSGAAAGGSSGPAIFRERAAETGLDFRHVNGMTGKYYLPEITGAGAAVFDYDNDGDLDVYLVQGGALGETAGAGTSVSDRLFRNDLVGGGDGVLRFTDVTTASGIDATEYGMGVATGDYDNDGDVDLYVTSFGPNRLFRNNGDGTFEDVTARAGVDDPSWSVPAAFFDYDRDGWLDLYVGNYVEFSYAVNKVCVSASGIEDYCSPNIYPAASDRLFHNEGDGTFEDVTAPAGLLAASGNALGAIPEDFDDDGWIDVFVANDGNDNQLWMNRGDGTFADEALVRGCAVNMEGRAEASMGVDVGDFDRDGDVDLFMTHLRHETNTLYVNRGDGIFDDLTVRSDLGGASRDYTGFGTAWLDFDLDGWLDLLVVNGAVQSLDHLVAAGDPFPLHQKDQLYRNLGDGRFRELSAGAGPYFELSDVGRGAAYGDIDNDGDTDVVVTNNNGPARLLLNEARREGASVGIVLEAGSGPRDAPGARIEVRTSRGPTLWHRVRTAGSYASASDPRVLLGLGPKARIERMRVEWPTGRIEEFDAPELDRYTTLVEGSGTTVTGPR